MKKHFQIGLFTTLVLVFFFYACKKDITPSQNETGNAGTPKKEMNSARLNWDGECPNNFTDEEIEFLGTEHNRLVIAATDNYRFNSNLSLMEALNQTFESNIYPELSQADFDDLQDRYSVDNFELTISETIDTLENEMQKEILTAMVNLVKDSSRQYEDIAVEIELLKLQAKENLSCFELNSTLMSLEVCKMSAKLWLPAEIGGDGYYDLITEEGSGKLSSSRRSWWRVLADCVVGDAIGAFTGFVRGAAPYFASGGPVNPVSNAAIATSALISGVSGSVSAGVRSVAN